MDDDGFNAYRGDKYPGGEVEARDALVLILIVTVISVLYCF